MSVLAGIDAIQVYGSTLAFGFRSLLEPRRFTRRALDEAGFHRRSVVPPWEDPVTLGVNAALPLFRSSKVHAHEVGLLIVATETGLDYGKPLSTYVHAALGLPTSCRNFEIKHACYSGTAALQMATSWVRSPNARGRKALLVMSDVSRRHFGQPTELTAGAGAVAVVVATNPRLYAIEDGTGVACREVYDVARPTLTSEYGDGVLSLCSYLDLVEGACQDYAATYGPVRLAEDVANLIYHLPLFSLVRQAHRTLVESFGGDPDDAGLSFERMVAPSLAFNLELGNVYGATVFVSLASRLASDPVLPKDSRIGCFSYGSGACSELFFARRVAGDSEAVGSWGFGGSLDARRCVGLKEYENSIQLQELSFAGPNFRPDLTWLPGHFESAYEGKGLLVLKCVTNHHRRYTRS